MRVRYRNYFPKGTLIVAGERAQGYSTAPQRPNAEYRRSLSNRFGRWKPVRRIGPPFSKFALGANVWPGDQTGRIVAIQINTPTAPGGIFVSAPHSQALRAVGGYDDLIDPDHPDVDYGHGFPTTTVRVGLCHRLQPVRGVAISSMLSARSAIVGAGEGS